MSHVDHEAIIVTVGGHASAVLDADGPGSHRDGQRGGLARHLRAFAASVCPRVTELVESGVNGYLSFAVLPDGSKEGWDEAEAGERARDAIVAELRRWVYDDGSSPVEWVEVEYSHEGAAVLRNGETHEGER